MKKFLLATAMTVATFASAPAFAQGHIGASASHTEVEVFGLEGDGNLYNVFGAAVLPLNETFSWQFDGDVAVTDIDGADDETAVSGTAHLYKGTDANKVGGFVGFTTADDYAVWNVGAEGQLFLDNVNLGGAVGYFNVDDLEVDGVGIRGTATVFANDNLSFGAGLAYASADAGGIDVDGWNARVGAEYQLPAAPLSFFAAYSRTDIEDADLEADSITLGLTYSFGTATLKERERNGASLDGLGGLAGMFAF